MPSTQAVEPRPTAAPSGREPHPSPEQVPVDRPPQPDLPRRQVLKYFGIGGATVLVAAVGVGSYRVFDTAALDPGGGQAYDPWQEWQTTPGPLGAVGAAVLAANPHNTQPWLFAVTETAIDVFVDPGRNIGSVDPYRREQHVGLGCALENLALACQARGLQPDIALLPDGADGARVAAVALTSTGAQRDARYDAIGTRHTNRGPYQQRAVPASALAGLVDTTGLPGLAIHWITDPDQMSTMGQLLVDAASAVIGDEHQSRDGFAWFRGDNDAVQTHRDGLTLDAQGLNPLMLAAAKLLPASTRSAGDAFWVDQTRTVHTATAAGYGVLTSAAPDDRATQLRAGRLLQRIHLTATAADLALHHMNQITERIDAEHAAGVAATFGPRFAQLLPPDAQPLVAFRVGYPIRDARPSPRRPVTDVTAAVHR